MLKCLYLIQASGKLPEIYGCLREKDFILLSYKEETEDTDIFYPNSTWTTGRNKLREHALLLEEEYDYYICLDEDIVFDPDEEADFNTLEGLLLEYKPFIAVPYLIDYPEYRFNNLKTEAQSTINFDGAFVCFSKKSFIDNKLFPYVDIFDDKNWWNSQMILIRLCKFYYNNQVVVFNNIKIHNMHHGEYPGADTHSNSKKGFWGTKLDTYEYVADLLISNKEIDKSDVINKLGEVDDIMNQTGLIEIKKAEIK